MAPIVFENVSKVYDDGTRAVNGLDLAGPLRNGVERLGLLALQR